MYLMVKALFMSVAFIHGYDGIDYPLFQLLPHFPSIFSLQCICRPDMTYVANRALKNSNQSVNVEIFLPWFTCYQCFHKICLVSLNERKCVVGDVCDGTVFMA